MAKKRPSRDPDEQRVPKGRALVMSNRVSSTPQNLELRVYPAFALHGMMDAPTA
jgi:hypothetical protein